MTFLLDHCFVPAVPAAYRYLPPNNILYSHLYSICFLFLVHTSVSIWLQLATFHILLHSHFLAYSQEIIFLQHCTSHLDQCLNDDILGVKHRVLGNWQCNVTNCTLHALTHSLSGCVKVWHCTSKYHFGWILRIILLYSQSTVPGVLICVFIPADLNFFF